MAVVPARQSMKPAGPVRQTYNKVDFIPQSGTTNLAAGQDHHKRQRENKLSSVIKIKKIGFFYLI